MTPGARICEHGPSIRHNHHHSCIYDAVAFRKDLDLTLRVCLVSPRHRVEDISTYTGSQICWGTAELALNIYRMRPAPTQRLRVPPRYVIHRGWCESVSRVRGLEATIPANTTASRDHQPPFQFERDFPANSTCICSGHPRS